MSAHLWRSAGELGDDEGDFLEDSTFVWQEERGVHPKAPLRGAQRQGEACE